MFTLDFDSVAEYNSGIESGLNINLESTAEYNNVFSELITVMFESTADYNINIANTILMNIEANAESNIYLSEILNIIFEAEAEYNSGIENTININYTADGTYQTEIFYGREILEALDYTAEGEFESVISVIAIDSLLLVLSSDLEILAYLEDYEDFIWNRKWRNPDNFELIVDRSKSVARFLRTDNYIAQKQGDDVHAGRIKTRNMKLNPTGEKITVSGKGLGEIFENRIAFNKVNEGDGYDSYSGPAESAMKYYVNVNVKNPDDTKRKIDKLVIATDNEKGGTINYKARFQKISKILYEISKTSGLGWDLVLDLTNKKFVFKVLTAKIRKGIRLSPDMDSVKMVAFKENKSSSENTILIAGQGSGASRMTKEVTRNDV